MVVAGGCGSGSVWRAGEGHVKLMLAVICFSLSTSLFKGWINSWPTLTRLMGERVFLPDPMGYKWSIIMVTVMMLIYYVLATWNEETDAFTVEL
jgi:uncharacterized membrane protein YedE/YeeE